MTKAHMFSASQVAAFPSMLRIQETIEPIIPGRAAAALPAYLAKARPRAFRCFFIHSLIPPLSEGSGAGVSESENESAYRHGDCCKDAHDRYPLLIEECASALSQRLVYMEEPPDCLTNSVDQGPESFSVPGEGFEPRLPFKLNVGELALQLFHSVSNILLNFCVVRFGQFSEFPGKVLFYFGLPVVGGA